MKIGDISFENNVFLAPMAGITDLPFRFLCKKEECGLTYSEMVSAKGLFYNDEKTKDLIVSDEIEKPFAVQIFGSDPEIMGEVVKQLNTYNFNIIDINMGCPTPKIVKNGDGSALMKNPELIGKIIRKVADSTSKPVTVKIRKGWDDNNINAVEISKIAQDNGAKAITVHGRTREQFYSGQADWEIIKKVKEAVSIPVIGNGDVFSPIDAKNMLEYTSCDGIMVGRGAKGNPWIFKRIITYLRTGELLPEITLKQRVDKILEQYDLMINYKSEEYAVKEMRKHVAWYLKGGKDSNKVKEKLYIINNFDEIKRILNEYKNEIVDC